MSCLDSPFPHERWKQMTITVLLAYFAYMPLTILMQQCIGHKYGARRFAFAQTSPNLVTTEWSIKALSMGAFTIFSFTLPGLPSSMTFVPIRAAGCLLILAGMALSGWAQIVLGKGWGGGGGALSKSHKLVQHGPFKYVRHPLYSGMIVSAIGQSLLVLNIWLALSALLMAASFVVKAPYEEFMLSKKYKKKWNRYVESTNWFFPSIKKG